MEGIICRAGHCACLSFVGRPSLPAGRQAWPPHLEVAPPFIGGDGVSSALNADATLTPYFVGDLPPLKRSRLREARASAGVGRSCRQAEVAPAPKPRRGGDEIEQLAEEKLF